jgi:hypothetical protein
VAGSTRSTRVARRGHGVGRLHMCSSVPCSSACPCRRWLLPMGCQARMGPAPLPSSPARWRTCPTLGTHRCRGGGAGDEQVRAGCR